MQNSGSATYMNMLLSRNCHDIFTQDAKPNQWGGIWLLPRVCLGLLQDYYSSQAKSKKKEQKL